MRGLAKFIIGLTLLMSIFAVYTGITLADENDRSSETIDKSEIKSTQTSSTTQATSTTHESKSLAENVAPSQQVEEQTSTTTKEVIATKITATSEKEKIAVGQITQLTVSVAPVDAPQIVTYQSSNPKVATVDGTGQVTGIALGKAQIIVTSQDGKVSTEITIEVVETSVTYQTHVQSIGWQNWVKNGAMSGTQGRSLRLEGIKIKLENATYSGEIIYQTHIQNIGWQAEQKDGVLSGTTGQSKRMEGIRIYLTDELAAHYDIYYRAHIQEIGWLSWAKNGQESGSQGLSARLEGIEIQLVPKNTKNFDTKRTFVNGSNTKFSYQVHGQNYGWQSPKVSGQIAGTTGQSKRIEAIRASIRDTNLQGNVSYRAHVQGIGWQNTVYNDAISGTVGQSRRLEALRISINGEISRFYDVYYRGHVEGKGWLAWTKNDGIIGSTGASKRLEAIEVRLVHKNGAAPSISGKSSVGAADYSNQKILPIFNSNNNIMSAGYYNLSTGDTILKNGDALVTSASTYKLFIALYVFNLMDTGKANWNTGWPGGTFRSGFYDMIINSGNNFSEWVKINYGSGNIDKFLKSKGYAGIFNNPDHATTSAKDLVNILKYYYNNSRNGNVAYLIDLMRNQIYRTGIPRGTCQAVADKVGFLWDIRNDAGIVYARQPYILVITTKNQYNFDLISDISRKIQMAQ